MITIEQFQVKYGRLPTETDPDYLQELERSKMLSKFQVMDLPIMAPGKCSNCGGTRIGDRKYVDFGLTLEYYGIVYLCTLCIKELMMVLQKNMGLVQTIIEKHRDLFNFEFVAPVITSPIPVANPIDDIKKIQEVARNIEDKIKQVIDVYQPSANPANSDNLDPVGNDPSSNLPTDEPVSKEKSNNTVVIRTKQRTLKQDTGSGRENIPGFTGFKSSDT